ncbi:MAG: hypothetical protein HUN04_05260 [Desulfobacter sp.]|nr:MAG: hypothetical protein HUN04_05260 [Desulfobacter sp.]
MGTISKALEKSGQHFESGYTAMDGKNTVDDMPHHDCTLVIETGLGYLSGGAEQSPSFSGFYFPEEYQKKIS